MFSYGYFLKKKIISLKKKNSDRTSQGPLVEVSSWRRLSKNVWGSFKEGSQVYDVMIDFREGFCFCFVLFSFFCLPELFSFISPPFFPFLKSSLSTKPTINNHGSLTTTYMHEFIDYKTSHTVKISLDYEYYTT